MIIPAQLIAEILGAGGLTTTVVASLKQWLENKRTTPEVTVTMSSSDGRQVELSGEEIKTLTAKEIEELIRNLGADASLNEAAASGSDATSAAPKSSE